MGRRNLDTQAIGKRAFTRAQTIIQEANHLIQPIDGDLDVGIDGYIRIRKKVKFTEIKKGKKKQYLDYVDTGNIVGVQVKGVTSIPTKKSNSYYRILKDKSKFAVNLTSKENLDKHKEVWKNFIGPMIMIFVDLETGNCWWADLNNDDVYLDSDYCITIDKSQIFNEDAFKKIKKLGRELFVANQLIDIDTRNHPFLELSLTDFKNSAKKFYKDLSSEDSHHFPTVNPTLGEIKYSQSGWKHITRLNRRKMRIINSLLLLGVSKLICERVERFTSVKKGEIRDSKQYIKKIEYLTLRANVNFNFRQSTIIQVVLRRVKTFDKLNTGRVIPNQVFFHSIYEPYRKE